MKDLLVQLASNEKVRKRFRQILLVSLMAIVVLEIVVLSPVPLEQETVRLTRRKFVDPKTILEEIQRKGLKSSFMEKNGMEQSTLEDRKINSKN